MRAHATATVILCGLLAAPTIHAEHVLLLFAYPPGQEYVRAPRIPKRDLIGAWTIGRSEKDGGLLGCLAAQVHIDQAKARMFHRREIELNLAAVADGPRLTGIDAELMADAVRDQKATLAQLHRWHYFAECISLQSEDSVGAILEPRKR